MIIYTSGTGNSKSVAHQLATMLQEDKVCDAAILLHNDEKLDIAADERLIFVMPVHSWGPALLMVRLVQRLKIKADKAWALFVCGDMCGNADKVFAKCLAQKGISLVESYSVQMPNNYILMKGFGIDSEELAQEKLLSAPHRIALIADAIKGGQTSESLYTRGGMPGIKTGLVYRLFGSLAVKKVDFHALDSCVGCGHCADICPTHNITLANGRPIWGKDCVQCVACIHRCPHNAIEYGSVSVGQGRYKHPDVEKKL